MNEHVALKVPETEYEADFYAWAYRQARFIRERRFDDLDIDNVAEEIEALARRDKTKVTSCLVVVIEHLLKLMCSPATDPRRGWRQSLIDERGKIEATWDDSPSLRRLKHEMFAKAWPRGLKSARLELSDEPDALAMLDRVAAAPPFDVDQALDDDFLPGAPRL